MSVWVDFVKRGVNMNDRTVAGEPIIPLKNFQVRQDAITSFSYFPRTLATYMGFYLCRLALLGYSGCEFYDWLAPILWTGNYIDRSIIFGWCSINLTWYFR
jgi:hypothetical protein